MASSLDNQLRIAADRFIAARVPNAGQTLRTYIHQAFKEGAAIQAEHDRETQRRQRDGDGWGQPTNGW